MEGCREPMVSTQVRTYPGPESACKLRAVICDNVVRDAALADGVFKEELGQFRPGDILPARSVDCHLWQSVHDNENPGVARCR